MNAIVQEHHAQEKVFEAIEETLNLRGYKIVAKDFDRPWGGFFVVDETQAPKFTTEFFEGIAIDELKISGKLSPKILLVKPGKRLSWQYHHRRAEIWKMIDGTAQVVISDTDEEKAVKNLKVNEVIRLSQGQRHRLVGLNTWGVVAEIWQHTDANHPSDENDIVRLQDDFGR